MQLLNQPPGLNLNGTDLIPKMLARADGQPIALFGTQRALADAGAQGGERAARARQRLRRRRTASCDLGGLHPPGGRSTARASSCWAWACPSRRRWP